MAAFTKNSWTIVGNDSEHRYIEPPSYHTWGDCANQYSTLLLFKTLKTEYKLEFYLKYPDNAIRKLICQFRVSEHSLGIERGRYYNIPRLLWLCEKCGVFDDETHFFLYCTINDRWWIAFLDDLLYLSRMNSLNEIDKIENILNPTSSQVKSLGSCIKRPLELRTGALDYICYIVCLCMIIVVCVCAWSIFCLFIADTGWLNELGSWIT